MKRRRNVTQEPGSVEDDDPRFVKVLNALAADRAFATIVDAYNAGRREAGRKFGSNGLKVNGKLFAMVTRGNLVVKLPNERVDALVAARAGDYFDPGHGRKMKQWISVTSSKISWIELVREAYEFVKRAS